MVTTARPPSRPGVARALDALLDTLALDPAATALAEIARALAAKLDEAGESAAAAMAAASAALAKELRQTLVELTDRTGDAASLIDDILQRD